MGPTSSSMYRRFGNWWTAPADLVPFHFSLPVVALITEASGTLQIIYIDEIYPLALQLPPNPIACTDWPARLIPISQHYPFCMGRRYLGSQQCQLCIVQRCAGHRSETGLEVCRCDGRDEGGYVGEGAVEGGDWGVIEIVAGCDGLDLVEGSVAGANHGHSAEGELVGGVDGGEPAAGLSGIPSARGLLVTMKGEGRAPYSGSRALTTYGQVVFPGVLTSTKRYRV